jgi:biotin carboxyl carrier protein
MPLFTAHAPTTSAGPLVVIEIHVRPRDRVLAGDLLLDVSAEEVDVEILAPAAGVVQKVLVTSGMRVAPGQRLVSLLDI